MTVQEGPDAGEVGLGTPGAQATGPVPGTGWTEVSLALMVGIWGVNFAVVKRALEVFEPLGFNTLRFVIASAFVFVVLRSGGRLRLPERADVPRVLMLGLIGNVLYQLAFIIGLDLTRAGNASLMLAMVPVFILLFNVVVVGQRPSGQAWLGAAVSVAGVGLVSYSGIELQGGSTLRGDLLMLSSAALWAIYTVSSQPLIERYGSVQTTAWTLWTGGVALAVIGAPSLSRQEWGAVDLAGWTGVLFSSVLSIGLAYLIWYRGVERLGGARTAIFSNLTPVVAMLTGAVWLGERIGPLSIAGAVMVIGGVMLVRGAPKAREA